MSEASKVCTKCQTNKSVGEFYASKATRDGLRPHCKACVKRDRAAYLAANRDKVRDYDRNRVRDPDAVRRYSATWRAKNVETAREIVRRNRARQYDADFGAIDVELVWQRDQSTCQLCGEPVDRSIPWPDPMSPSIDHVVALSRGGLHTVDNVALTHLLCNQRKGDRET